MHPIYNTIKKLRLTKGFTQEYVAEKLGMLQGNYTKLESGKAQITIERLEKIAEVFGMTVLELLAGHEQTSQKKTDVEVLEREKDRLERELKNLEIAYLREKVDNLKKIENRWQLNEYIKVALSNVMFVLNLVVHNIQDKALLQETVKSIKSTHYFVRSLIDDEYWGVTQKQDFMATKEKLEMLLNTLQNKLSTLD